MARKIEKPEKTDKRPLWQRIVEIGERLPPDVQARLPVDLAENVDVYLYR